MLRCIHLPLEEEQKQFVYRRFAPHLMFPFRSDLYDRPDPWVRAYNTLPLVLRQLSLLFGQG